MIEHPTLDLFLYDLRESLGDSSEQIDRHRRRFRQKLPAEIDDALFKELDEKFLEPEYVELLGQSRKKTFDTPVQDGYYYPVRLGDAYGLLMDCSLKQSQSAEDLTWLKELQNFFTTQLQENPPTLGQTWMFSGVLSNYEKCSPQDLEALAKACYHTLAPKESDWQADKVGTAECFGGVLFECRHLSPLVIDANSQLSYLQTGNYHVVIGFYPHRNQFRKSCDELQFDWLRLFHYRHKMKWAYDQSQLLKRQLKQLKQEAAPIEQYKRELSRYRLSPLPYDELRQALKGAWSLYASATELLILLDDQSRTIGINLENYHRRLGIMEEKAKTTLTCFYSFSQQEVEKKYWLQIQKDYANLKPGFELLNQAIQYLEIQVATVEKERREKAFHDTVAIGGVALAAGAIVASISGHFPTVTALNEEKVWHHPIGFILASLLYAIFFILGLSKAWLAPGISILISFGTVVLAGWITKDLIKRKQHK